MTATPNTLAHAKQNALHVQIAKALDQTKPTSWTHKQIDPASENENKPDLIETKRSGYEFVNPLARNVSQENVERFLERAVQ